MNKTLALLAVGIGEWTAALQHVEVLDSIGQPRLSVLRGRIERERAGLCQQWQHALGGTLFALDDVPAIVAEARAWATAHQQEIDALLNREEVST